MLVLIGVLAGILLALAWIFQVSWSERGPRVVLRSPGTYIVSVDALIDTTGFGIGRSDTDMYKLSLMAPTYAQLMMSQAVLDRAETILGRPIEAKVTATAPNSVPIVQLSVEGADASRLVPIASAVVRATRDYVAASQAENDVPEAVRLTVRAMGRPSEPSLVSDRRVEIALILLLFPIVVAVVLAHRLEYPVDQGSRSAASVGSSDEL